MPREKNDDEEIERRELEAQRSRLSGKPPPQEEHWIQQDFWGYSDAYQSQFVF